LQRNLQASPPVQGSIRRSRVNYDPTIVDYNATGQRPSAQNSAAFNKAHYAGVGVLNSPPTQIQMNTYPRESTAGAGAIAMPETTPTFVTYYPLTHPYSFLVFNNSV
jgi:hypothetical protein